MKTSSSLFTRLLRIGAVPVICLLALPLTSHAKGPVDFWRSRGMPPHSQGSHQHDADVRARHSYSAHPRSGFTLSFGSGYAGRGYYYGPPNSPYYYQRSDVRYYETRNLVPREYSGQQGYRSQSVGSAVQRELASRGFYRGYIDGQIGPQSRRAIASYQQSRGLRPTGEISTGLLHSLGLQ